MDPERANLGFRAHMSLLGLDGAGTWLHAIPSEALGTKVPPQFFNTMLQRRLRMQIFKEPFYLNLFELLAILPLITANYHLLRLTRARLLQINYANFYIHNINVHFPTTTRL